MGTKKSGNREAGGKAVKYGNQLAARTRGAILNAFDAVERDGQLLSEVLAEAFRENPLKFLDTAAKYVPKDINLNKTPTNYKDMSDEQLQDIIAQRAVEERKRIQAELESEQQKQAQTGPIAV